jgi:serine/threonine protein kinase
VWRADLTVLSPVEQSIEVAVKSINDKATRKDIANFLLEAESLKSVNANGGHPNVLRLVGCSLQEIPPLIVIEYAANGSLKAYLEFKIRPSGCIDIMMLLRFAQEAAAGMAFLADLQIVHRGWTALVVWPMHPLIHPDLAARNCLVMGDMSIRVSDFGLSKMLSDGENYYNQKHDTALPIRWMAPESLINHRFSTKSKSCYSTQI